MDWWFYFTIIIGLSLLYYGYENKKKYELKRKTMELKHELKIREMELEIVKIENSSISKQDFDFPYSICFI